MKVRCTKPLDEQGDPLEFGKVYTAVPKGDLKYYIVELDTEYFRWRFQVLKQSNITN